MRCAVAKRGVHLLGRELRLQVARHRCDLEMGHGTVDQAHVDLVTGLQRPQPVKAAGPGGRLLAKVSAELILARRRTQPEPAGPGILDGHLDGPIGVEPEGGRHQRDTYGRDPQHDRYRTCHYPGRLTDPGADGVRAIWLMACPTAWLTVSLMARRLVSLACERTTATGWTPECGTSSIKRSVDDVDSRRRSRRTRGGAPWHPQRSGPWDSPSTSGAWSPWTTSTSRSPPVRSSASWAPTGQASPPPSACCSGSSGLRPGRHGWQVFPSPTSSRPTDRRRTCRATSLCGRS